MGESESESECEEDDGWAREAEEAEERAARWAYTSAYVTSVANAFERALEAREARGVRESEGREDAYEEEEEEEEEEEAYEEEEEASTSEDEERDAKRTSERAEAAPLAAAMTATTTIATEPEPEPERDVDRQNTAATVVSSVAVAPAAKSVVAVSAKFVAALAVGATAVVAPFVMGGSSNSLAPGPTSSLSSRLRDVNFFNSRGRSLNSYEGPNWRAMERAEATAAANVAPLQQRLAEMEEELRQANDELERAREEVDNAAKTRRKLAQAQTEASEASAREAAAVADRDAVWKALRGQLSDAAKARATIETESLSVAADLEQAKTALDEALKSKPTCDSSVGDDDDVYAPRSPKPRRVETRFEPRWMSCRARSRA